MDMHGRTDANRFYNLPQAICYSYGADRKHRQYIQLCHTEHVILRLYSKSCVFITTFLCLYVYRWFLDGNFAMAPPVFANGQLYVIRAPLASTYVTCVYALLAGKSQAEYEELLRAVVAAMAQLGVQPQLEHVITDFEVAIMRATSDVFGSDVQQLGCFYHLTQSTWRKVGFLLMPSTYILALCCF